MLMLDLFGNLLDGFIPSELGQLVALTALGLNDNSLKGSIPSELGQLGPLIAVYLYDNYVVCRRQHSIGIRTSK